jgi:hypothetical protein
MVFYSIVGTVLNCITKCGPFWAHKRAFFLLPIGGDMDLAKQG